MMLLYVYYVFNMFVVGCSYGFILLLLILYNDCVKIVLGFSYECSMIVFGFYYAFPMLSYELIVI